MDGGAVVPVDVDGAAEDAVDIIWVLAVMSIVGSPVVVSIFVSVAAPTTVPAWNVENKCMLYP